MNTTPLLLELNMRFKAAHSQASTFKPTPSSSLPPFKFICFAIKDFVAGTQVSYIPEMAPQSITKAGEQRTR